MSLWLSPFWLPLAVVLPFAAALGCWVAGPRRAGWVAVVGVHLNVLAALALAAQLLARGSFRHAVGGWGAPLGIDLQVDGLSALMLVMTAVVGYAISLYARGYFADQPKASAAFWPLWFFLWGGLYALFLTADIFNFYVTLEVVSLSAVALVAISGTPSGLTASLRYLLTALTGSLLYLLGVGLIYAQADVLDLELLRGVLGPTPATHAAYVCMTLGLLIKAALFPFHTWLPPAHSQAPAPVSAALSALVVKGAFYILVRLHLTVWPEQVRIGLASGLGALGLVAVIWGSLQALRQPRLKLMIAYSTVAQVGYLFLIFPLCFGTDGFSAVAWKGAWYHVVSHAVAKASLFLAAGAVLHAAGGDTRAHLRGLGERRPLLATALALAAVSIMGLPPSGGFVGKWLLLSASLSIGAWWWVGGLLLGGLLSAAYNFRFLRELFRPAPDDLVLHDEPKVLSRAALFLAVLALLMGLFTGPVLGFLVQPGWEGGP